MSTGILDTIDAMMETIKGFQAELAAHRAKIAAQDAAMQTEADQQEKNLPPEPPEGT